MKLFTFYTIAAFFFLLSCSSEKTNAPLSEAQLKAFADTLAHRYIIVDGHIDLPDHLKEIKYNITKDKTDILLETTTGDFDYNRSKKGGLDAPFMSIYIPKEYQAKKDMGKALADSLIATVKGIASHLPDKFALATSTADIEKNFRDGKISLPMGMENGAPIGYDIGNLKYFYDQGIRYITLTHNKDNQICDSSRDSTHTSGGLSKFGRDVVVEMNRLGIMVDISHVDDSTFYQVMKLSKAPCIASHSSCRALVPSAVRDMTDDMLKTLGTHEGVVMINFYNSFLSENFAIFTRRLDSLLKTKNLKATDPDASSVIENFKKENQELLVTVATVADHIDHAVAMAGIDHVGIGSDYDGVEGSANLPEGLKDVSQYPNLILELLKRGYKEEDIQKICSGNILRVWKKVEEVSQASSK